MIAVKQNLNMKWKVKLIFLHFQLLAFIAKRQVTFLLFPDPETSLLAYAAYISSVSISAVAMCLLSVTTQQPKGY